MGIFSEWYTQYAISLQSKEIHNKKQPLRRCCIGRKKERNSKQAGVGDLLFKIFLHNLNLVFINQFACNFTFDDRTRTKEFQFDGLYIRIHIKIIQIHCT
jgi:hypothetical protein